MYITLSLYIKPGRFDHFFFPEKKILCRLVADRAAIWSLIFLEDKRPLLYPPQHALQPTVLWKDLSNYQCITPSSIPCWFVIWDGIDSGDSPE